MRSLRSLVLVAAVAALLLPAVASAQVESTPIPAPNKPNFSSMAFMVGSWSCATKSARRPAAYMTTVSYTMDPTGYWMEQTSVTKPTSWVTKQLTVYDKITYDPDTKRWVDVTYGDGGGYGLAFSKGLVGNHITWHDVSFAPGPDISAQSDVTYTKVSATKLTSASSFTETKTGRHVAVTTTCTKT